MSLRRPAWLLAAPLCAALLAGCGGSSSGTTTSTASSTTATQSTPAATTSTAPASTQAAPPATTAPTATTPSKSTSAASIAQLATTVCKSTAVRAKLPAAMKAKVEEICHDAATGHQTQAEETARKVCVEAIDEIPGPTTAAKEQALKECAK